MNNYIMNKPKQRLPRKIIVVIAVGFFLVIGGSIAIRQIYVENLRPISNSETTQSVVVPVGASVKQIASILNEAGIIRSPWAFEWYVRNNSYSDALFAGTYSLRPNQSVEEIVAVLTVGDIEKDLITILPGKRLDQIRSILINAGFDEPEVDRALIPATYANHPVLADKPADSSFEGYLYPESFQKTAETSPSVIVRASLDELQKVLTPELRKGFVAQGLTVHQAIIIASIVEKEASNPDDRTKIAQVFLTRLKIGMRLGSDITAFYGATIANQEPSVGFDSPYNTRIYYGFPPGPVSNVGEGSLKAVAYPADTNYLYFVAGDNGTVYFSSTLAEHEALARQYCDKLCE